MTIWDPALVVASIVLGAAIGAAALPVGLRGDGAEMENRRRAAADAGDLQPHFTAMGAASFIPDPAIAFSPSALAGAVARDRGRARELRHHRARACRRRDRHARPAARRARNRPHARTRQCRRRGPSGLRRRHHRHGQRQLFAARRARPPRPSSAASSNDAFPTKARGSSCWSGRTSRSKANCCKATVDEIPVELILRPVVFAGKTHRAIAVRDLQARKEAEQHIRFLAHHDALTGLPNRSSFNKQLDQEIEIGARPRQAARGAVPRSRPLQGGQRPVRPCGRRQRSCSPSPSAWSAVLDDSQMMARLSGDEFAILVPGISNPAAAGRLAETILESLRAAGDNRRHRCAGLDQHRHRDLPG